MYNQNHDEECGMNKVLIILGVQLVLLPQSIWLVMIVMMWVEKDDLLLVV